MKQVERSNSMPFVADGRKRALAGASLEFKKRCARIKAAIRKKYAPRLHQAGMIRRFWLLLQIRFEVFRQMRREKKKIAPTRALYAATQAARTKDD
jgi:hypothetical protein